MNCQEIKRKLSAYQDKELPGWEMDAIKNHLNNCDDCLKAFQGMEQVWDFISDVETIESAPYFWAKLSQRIKPKEKKRPAWNIIFSPAQKLSFSIVATCLIMFGLVIGMFLGQNIYHHSQLAPTSEAEQELDQVFPMESFEDFPEQSVAQAYVTMISENNQ